MNKDMEMLHYLAHESKQPLYHFRKYVLSDRVLELFKRSHSNTYKTVPKSLKSDEDWYIQCNKNFYVMVLLYSVRNINQW